MAWQKKGQDFVDPRTGYHVIPLIEAESGAEHKLQITVGHDSCPHCGTVSPKTNLGEIDTQAIIAGEIASLNMSHGLIQEYAKKHRVAVRKDPKK